VSARPPIIIHADKPGPVLDVLGECHPDLQINACDNYAGLAEAIARVNAEVVYSVRFAGTPLFPRQALVDSPTVRWVSVGGSGTDHLRPWDAAKVTVTNAAGVAADMMAEYVLAAMLSFSLDLPGFAEHQRARRWTAGKVEPIAGRTVLILGLGKSGQAIARRAKAMDMMTLGVRARPKPTANVDEVHGTGDLSKLWGRADFIVCCLPLIETTRGLIATEAFAAMKPNAVLIDVSRGGIVEEAALLAALDTSRIKGAALDVFAAEPLPSDHPLWEHKNVMITPHCSSVYDGWETKSARMFAENLSRYRCGQALHNVVDPARGY
jgi:phosphoglycerate dehydrogenase-like enzyme